MKKEKSVTLKAGEVNGRLTRARAAAFRASGQLPPLKGVAQESQKQPQVANPKRAVSDNTCLPRKKRAVLQDVTNISCENTYRSCSNATKIQVAMHPVFCKENHFISTYLMIIVLVLKCIGGFISHQWKCTNDAKTYLVIFVSARLRKASWLLNQLNLMFQKLFLQLLQSYRNFKLTRKRRVCQKWGVDQKMACAQLIWKTMHILGRAPINVAQMIIIFLTARHLEYLLSLWFLKRKVLLFFTLAWLQ